MNFVILSVFLNMLVLCATMIFWYIYYKQYRFATMLTDMVPYYPYLIGILTLINILSSISLVIEGYLVFIIVLVFTMINGAVQEYYFYNWKKAYRFSEYTKLLEKLKENPQIKVISYNDWLDNSEKDPELMLILIRHDIDINLNRAKRMFDEEKKYSIPSCYFIRNNAERYTFSESKVLLGKIAERDEFSIGLHYETIKNAEGDLSKAKILFTEEIQTIREKYKIRMIAAHGDKFRNRRLITENIVDLDILNLISSYDLPHDYYLSDAGGKHHFKGKNGDGLTFNDQLEVLRHGKPGSLVQILIHPDWWF